jgi:signal transduction histidine kinase
MNDRWKAGARELLTNPLAWASYAAWAAVWLTVTGVFGSREMRWWADGLLVLFLLAWLGCMLDDVLGRRVFDACLAALTAITITVLWLVPAGGATPILLILLATQFAHRFAPRELTFSMVGINLVFAGIMLFVWEIGPSDTGFSLLGFIGFQMFAVLVMRYAIRAEEMAEDLKSVNARLLATRSLLGETARDQERLRLSRELHDVAGHKVTALKLNLRGLARRLDAESAAEVGKATDLADELLQDLRSVVRHLRRTEGIELSDSLRELARPFPRPKLELDLDEQARIPRADQAEALLRVVQEALTNAARHGPAENLVVRLRREADRLVLTVEDDGRVAGAIRPGNGLTGMRERLVELDGSLEISNSDAGGLKLTATLPLELH